MNLCLHLSIHLFFALLAGIIIWLIFRRHLLLALIGGVLGGFLVDLDHLIDYFLAFHWNFNFRWFTQGYEFIKTDQIHLFFHAWEYVIILLVVGFLLKNKKLRILIFSLSLGMFFHLTGDVIMNEGLMTKSYSMIYKIEKDFQIKQLVTPEHYEYNQEKRQWKEVEEMLENS